MRLVYVLSDISAFFFPPGGFKMLVRRLRLAATCALALVAAACADQVASPTLSVPEPSRSAATPATSYGLQPSKTPYYCVAGRLAVDSEDRYEYGGRRLRFPRAELAEDGSSLMYRVHSLGADGEVAGSARCLIPNTPHAIRRMDRLFKISPIQRAKLPGGGGVSIQSVGLDPITAYGCRYGGTYPWCDPKPIAQQTMLTCGVDDPYCGSGGGDAGDDPWLWGGSGENPTPDEPDDVDRPVCERDEKGHCKLVIPNDDQWRRFGELINRMTEQTEYCAGAKRIAQSFFAQGKEAGRIQLWNGRDTYLNEAGIEKMDWGRNTFDANGRLLAFDSYVVFNTHSLIAHEALHAYLASIAPTTGLMPPNNETWVREHQRECAG